MNLFNADPTDNLLPSDGIANYYGPILNAKQSEYFEDILLKTTAWEHDEAVIFGKHIVTARKVAWYGDAALPYTYSKITKHALPWSKELRELKSIVEEATGSQFNSCLLNLYHDGNEGMGWHSDDEKSLVMGSSIASVSLGAERTFRFRHKVNNETISVRLENGSLLVMKGETQTKWRHSLPKSKKIRHPRINLTFRVMIRS